MKKSPSHTPAAAGRVLLVDDNRNGLTARKALLEEQGFVITTATNGRRGWKRSQRANSTCMITDFKMPKMNGIELIRRVKSLQPDLPVILLSGYVESLGFDEQSTGADIVIAKGTNEISHSTARGYAVARARKAPRKPSASQKNRPAKLTLQGQIRLTCASSLFYRSP